MTRQQARQAFADALSTVVGVTGHPVKPSTLNEGDAWPQWRGSARGRGAAFEDTWAVLVVLPQADDVTADTFADEHADALAEALRPLLFVESIAPASIGTDAAPMYALLITGRSE